MNNNEPVMNPEKIEEFKGFSNGNDDFIIELFEKYFDNSELLINNIRNSCKDGNEPDALFNIHSFKGSSRNMGLIRMGEFLKNWEMYIKEKKLSNCEQKITEMERLFEEIKKFYSEKFSHQKK